LDRLAAKMGCCALHSAPLVCPDCDLEVNSLSRADKEELW
jgi:hypothetical protein